MTIKCIIVEDEPLARELLKDYIAKVPSLILLDLFDNAIDAMSYLSKNHTDLIFLDINMPVLSGMSMLRSLSNVPDVIITTAYPEFAVEGFDLEVTDYLLKPFSFERFLKAVNRVVGGREKPVAPQSDSNSSFISVKSDKKIFRLQLSEILILQSYGDYVKVITTKSEIVTYNTLKHYEERLSLQGFIRIHKSYIVNKAHIDFVEGNQVVIGSAKIPVGASYKDQLLQAINSK